MNSNGLLKARTVILIIQVLASLLVVFAVIVAIIGSKEIKSFEDIMSIKDVELFFGTVMAARVCAIITFSTSIISAVISFFTNYNMSKYICETVCSIGMFIISFILTPFSSAVNFANSLTNNIINSIYNYGNQASSNRSTLSITAPLIILLVLAVIVFFISTICTNDKPKKNRSILVKRTPEKAKIFCSCGAEIPHENKFCGVCGKPAPIDMICQYCGAKIPLGNSFCGICGTKINPD